MAHVIWAPSALADVEAACAYVARDAPAYAADLAQRLFLAVERLADFPESGRPVPEFADPSLREVIVGVYRVLYELTATSVHVLTVHHGARLLSRRPRRRSS